MKKDFLKKVRITDTTLRDAHQSLWATRMRTDDILQIAEKIDEAGYYSLECWGGATFDVCMRFLRENPWERLRQIKAVCKKTPLQMLFRGQNILGYKHYPDDIVERFTALACENGMDIFRVFDALNDPRNLEKAISCVKKYGGHAQGTLCYTTSPVHTVEKYVELAKEQQAMGIDSLCIKDMAGILTPGAARELVAALVQTMPEMPIQVHSHMTSGMAAAMYMAAVEAGAGCVDCATSTMSSFSSQPPCESIVTILESEGYDTGLDQKKLAEINAYFQNLKKTRQQASSAKVEPVDAGVLVHAIPGGMISNLRSQLAQQGALDVGAFGLCQAGAGDQNKVVAGPDLVLVQAVGLAQQPLAAVADDGAAQLGAHGQADPVVVGIAPIFENIEHQQAVARGFSPVIKPAEFVVLLDGGCVLHCAPPFCMKRTLVRVRASPLLRRCPRGKRRKSCACPRRFESDRKSCTACV